MRAATLIALLSLACSREAPDVARSSPPQSTTVAGNTSTQASNTVSPPLAPQRDLPASRPTAASPTQEVQLIEYAIRMPETLPAGHIAFNVQNAGREQHGFEIEGNGIEEKTDILQRGDTTSLEMDLRPGTYTVYCPVKGHKEKGCG
jgi:hypothetical protein